VSHETVRQWWNRSGPLFATDIGKKRSSVWHCIPQWRWHLDEVFVKINGQLRYLWRAVDHEGEVLEAIAAKRRDRKAAPVLLKKLMKRYGRPYVIVTDKLRSYAAAMKVIGNADRQECGGQWINNRAENSHQPFRRRERAMHRFRLMSTLQKFASVHAAFHNHFNHERHMVDRGTLQGPSFCRDAGVADPCELTSRTSTSLRLAIFSLTIPACAVACGLVSVTSSPVKLDDFSAAILSRVVWKRPANRVRPRC
jgi:putative transposase